MKYITDEEIERLGLEDIKIDVKYNGLVCRMFGNDYEWYYMFRNEYGYLILERGSYT